MRSRCDLSLDRSWSLTVAYTCQTSGNWVSVNDVTWMEYVVCALAANTKE